MITADAIPPEKVLNVNVGVLGHVDSGKTSLVKTLSTLLSTAALDKSKQSRQRGMTLDLGFSCFFLDIPKHLSEKYPSKEKLQMTLVDCPGHASLIRTIIGGAQIIDMVLLVVDAYKGWQAQTTECLVLAELTSSHLIVALNKIDMFPPKERKERLEQTKRDVWRRLEKTRFASCTLVGVSVCVGGEKVAATKGEEIQYKSNVATSDNISSNETINVDLLVDKLQQELPPPKRDFSESTFYFSIDHCFPIRGQGTILTGTVLSGNIVVNSMIEFPTLGMERKIKSMQMFRRKVQQIGQGDRAGICVSNLDPKLLERGIAASPGAIHLLKGAIAVVRKVSYYPGVLKCGSKFHVSVGHTTVMATLTFWGAHELYEKESSENNEEHLNKYHRLSSKTKNNAKALIGHSSLGGDADMAGLPRIRFDFQKEFLQQNFLLEEIEGKRSNLLHWAMLDFQTPVYCPLDSLIIGSRLDVEAPDASSSSSCRLAFSGRILQKVDPGVDITRLKLYTSKEKRGVICKLGDPFRRDDDQKVVRYEIFGDDLFKKETNMKVFTGMKLLTPSGDVGEIKGSYGTTGKYRVWFPAGTDAKEGDDLILKFKRYVHDDNKEMHQDILLPNDRVGSRLEIQQKIRKKKKNKALRTGSIVSLKGSVLESNGKHSIAIITGFFRPEVNIREAVGARVLVPSTKEEGKILGSFGKAGKCKVFFEEGISADVGSQAEMFS